MRLPDVCLAVLVCSSQPPEVFCQPEHVKTPSAPGASDHSQHWTQPHWPPFHGRVAPRFRQVYPHQLTLAGPPKAPEPRILTSFIL